MKIPVCLDTAEQAIALVRERQAKWKTAQAR